MRAFLALPLPDDVCGALARLQDELPLGRALPVENLHLTLVFLGDIPQEQAERVHAALSALRAAPVTLRLHGLDTFGGRRPRVLHAAASGPEALRTRILSALRTVGIVPERRRYRPHVTLARLPAHPSRHDQTRLAEFMAAMAGFSLPPVRLDRFAFYRSELHRDGARHEMLAQYVLSG